MNVGKFGTMMAAVGCMVLSASAEVLLSPNGTCRLEVGVAEGGVPVYSLTCKGKTAIRESRLGFVFTGRAFSGVAFPLSLRKGETVILRKDD